MSETEHPAGDSRPAQNPFPILPPDTSGSPECRPPGAEARSKPPRPDQDFVSGTVETPVGPVPRASSVLTAADRWESIKARWGIGRMHYTVDPGLYSLGNPDENSPVLVTANYKMSFDRLRQALPGRDAWILVLETYGINVWCAAGKGTFGTEELVRRTQAAGVSRVVAHKRLILPQLGASGVAAHLVKRLSGFRVVYGPIRASDLPAFLDAGLKAAPEMRTKTFDLRERAALIPVELVEALKYALIVLPIFFLLGGLGGPHDFWSNALDRGLFAVAAILSGIAAGAVFTPLLLPWLPGRAFTTKGLTLGLATAAVLAVFHGGIAGGWAGRLELAGWFLLVPALAGYLAMNFTGASAYTSLSGVRKEMKWAVPVEIGAGALGLLLWMGSRFVV